MKSSAARDAYRQYPLNQAQNFALQSDSARLKALVDELELAQLSANNRRELARLRSELAEKRASSWMHICKHYATS